MGTKVSSICATISTCHQRLCPPPWSPRGPSLIAHDPPLDPDRKLPNFPKIVKLTYAPLLMVVTRREMLEPVPTPTWNSEEDMDVAVLPHPSKDCTDYEDFLRINVLVHKKKGKKKKKKKVLSLIPLL